LERFSDCYEGLPWFTAAAALIGGLPPGEIILLAAAYSIGAHGIMTLNDYKAIEGDRRLGIRSLPVQLGPDGAARVACIIMLVPQLLVVGLLIHWQLPLAASVVALLILVQGTMMIRFLGAPADQATWYRALGVPVYVLGMLASAIGVRSLPL
jgi:chlorophyll synthase